MGDYVGGKPNEDFGVSKISSRTVTLAHKVKSLGFHVLVLSLPTQIQDTQDAYIPQIIDAFAASSIFLSCSSQLFIDLLNIFL